MAPMPTTDELIALWLATRLLVRPRGRTIDLDAVAPDGGAWAAAIAPLRTPLTLVTGWNPQGRAHHRGPNRQANRALRAELEGRGVDWRPALGRARDGSWAEPGFAVGGLAEDDAATLGAAWDQLAVYVIDAWEVAVVACDGSFRFARPRGATDPGPGASQD